MLAQATIASWYRNRQTLESLAAYSPTALTLKGPAGAETISGAWVTAGLFSVLATAPVLGRTFLEYEEASEPLDTVVLSYGLWQRCFRGDPEVLGTIVYLNGVAHSVIGVMPPTFSFPDKTTEIWTLMPLEPASADMGRIVIEHFASIARLKQGFTADQAAAEGQRFLAGAQASNLDRSYLNSRIRLISLRDSMAAGSRPALLMLFLAVILVLLIACANLTNLILAHNATLRETEFAIRAALGCSPSNLLRQILAENCLTSLLAGALGVGIASGVLQLLPHLLPDDLPRLEEIGLNWRILLFGLLLSLAAGVIVGLLPALRASRTQPAGALSARSGRTRAHRLLQDALIIFDVALATILLIGAGLLLHSFFELVSVDPGFEPRAVETAILELNTSELAGADDSGRIFDEVLLRLKASPEVSAAGAVSLLPFTSRFSLTPVSIAGQAPRRMLACPQLTSPGYRSAMGLRLAAGRWLSEQDHIHSAPVAVVNETFVHSFLASESAVGQRVEIGSAELEIVGVVSDVHLLGLDADPKPEIFTSFHHSFDISGDPPTRMALAVRGAGDPAHLASLLREAVHEVAPNLALRDLRTMESRLADSVARPRFYALLLAIFAGIAVALAAAGSYSALSYSVSRRRREIGIRRALGAQDLTILRMTLGNGLRPASLGLAAGWLVSFLGSKLISHLLFGVAATDLWSYVGASLILAGVCALACYMPARRAIRTDPLVALRYE